MLTRSLNLAIPNRVQEASLLKQTQLPENYWKEEDTTDYFIDEDGTILIID